MQGLLKSKNAASTIPRNNNSTSSIHARLAAETATHRARGSGTARTLPRKTWAVRWWGDRWNPCVPGGVVTRGGGYPWVQGIMD